jgi:hypothetical protein
MAIFVFPPGSRLCLCRAVARGQSLELSVLLWRDRCRLAGKVAVITGAASGIGKATVLA